MCFLSLITRCRNEYYISEFVEHYINEGVDLIHIIDDDSSWEYPENLILNNKVKIYKEKDVVVKNKAQVLYDKIRYQSEWLIYVDVDEFVTTRKYTQKTIRDELQSTFRDFDCVKIPWVMMSSNGRSEKPVNLLSEVVSRWNHDKKHPNSVTKNNKFRCRYDQVEVKCIFKPRKFSVLWDHHPKGAEDVKCVDSVFCGHSKLDPFYSNLREVDIANAYLVCYHFRIVSLETAVEKIKNNIWYSSYAVEDLLSTDYAELIDQTLKKKSEIRNGF